MKLVPILESERNGTLPIATATAYKWHSQCRYPRLIIKISNKLFFDFDEWEAMARRQVEERIREAKRIEEEREGAA